MNRLLTPGGVTLSHLRSLLVYPNIECHSIYPRIESLTPAMHRTQELHSLAPAPCPGHQHCPHIYLKIRNTHRCSPPHFCPHIQTYTHINTHAHAHTHTHTHTQHKHIHFGDCNKDCFCLYLLMIKLQLSLFGSFIPYFCGTMHE